MYPGALPIIPGRRRRCSRPGIGDVAVAWPASSRLSNSATGHHLVERWQRLYQRPDFARRLGRGHDVGRLEFDDLGLVRIGLPYVLADEPTAVVIRPDHLQEVGV